MMAGRHIMVVDDEPAARELVGDYLTLHGFQVTLCDGAAALRRAFATTRPDLVVLDLNMPGEDGLAVLADLKRGGDGVPVIMLTATASSDDRVAGLDLGADDYVAKPCELRELMARVRSVLRRAGELRQAAPREPQERIRFGTKWLDLAGQLLRDDEGGEHVLTGSEFSLLKAFAENPRRVLSRDRLLDLAGARDPDAFDRAIDVRITRIRKKVEPDPEAPAFIKTVRGAGYMFLPDGERR
jgi:DNA-binding response OmpR family regulator